MVHVQAATLATGTRLVSYFLLDRHYFCFSEALSIYCDVLCSPCPSKKRVKCTVRFFKKKLSVVMARIVPCLVAVRSPESVC